MPATHDLEPALAPPDPAGGAFAAWFTVRRKLFAALALLAIVGGSGGLLSVLDLRALARTYQREQTEVAVHEAIHEDRIALLSLLDLVNRAHRDAGAAASLRPPFEARLTQLTISARACAGCHGDEPDHAAYATRLDDLRRDAAARFAAAPAPAAAAALLDGLSAALGPLGDAREDMEARFHALLDRRRQSGESILRPSLGRQLGVVALGLSVALVLAWLMARALGHSMLPLIAAARRTGGRGAPALAEPRDPDLAQVAGALHELTTVVASRAREDARRQLLDRTISSQEDERRRVARELHDVIGQSLSALLMEIRARRGGDDGGARIPDDVLEGRVSGLLDEVHRMSWDLRPSLLDDLGLRSALARYGEDVERRHGIPVDFQAVGLDEGGARLPGHVETVLYRVAQEALSNVLRHAHAHRTSVVLVRRGAAVALLVEDDGDGFDVDAARRDRASLGLLGMEERVALVGGSLTIVSTRGEGTSVRAQIPLAGRPA